MAETWTKIGRTKDFQDGLVEVRAGRKAIVVGRIGGEIVAFSALCPHRGGPMQYAEVNGSIITCPLHGWRFDVSRAGQEIHDYRRLATYAVRIKGDEVFVAV